MNKESNKARVERFRSAIAAFIAERREAKLKGSEDDGDTAAKYDYSTWLADAARRVGQIQAVTHVLKATHPDARGSSLHVSPADLPEWSEVGTHVLAGECADDVVGNAAALDVYKFLKVEVDGRRLLDWMQAEDADLREALDPMPATASAWMAAFGDLVRSEEAPTTHTFAKQVYWLTGDEPARDGDYHLLQPMFSSALAHAVHLEIQEARFGETNTEARKAFRARAPHEGAYREYRQLVARKLGGTKPQNISQLNSERGGVNYLLASLPPRWRREEQPRLLHIDSVLDRVAYATRAGKLVEVLAKFLLGDPPPNDRTRRTREAIEQELGAQLPLFAAGVSAHLAPGWTRDADCRLALCEQLWLDPERTALPLRDDPDHPEWAEADREFNEAFVFGDWPDQVAGRFANWVNARLIAAGLKTVGDAEHRHWARQALIDAVWPVPMQRRAPMGALA